MSSSKRLPELLRRWDVRGRGNSCTVEDWQMDEKLVRLAERLSEYYEDRMDELGYVDEYNEITCGRPVSYPGL